MFSKSLHRKRNRRSKHRWLVWISYTIALLTFFKLLADFWDEPTISPSIIKYTILSLLELCDMHTEISSQDNAAEPPTTSSAPSMNPYDNGDDQFDFILNSMCFWMIQSISGQ